MLSMFCMHNILHAYYVHAYDERRQKHEQRRPKTTKHATKQGQTRSPTSNDAIPDSQRRPKLRLTATADASKGAQRRDERRQRYD